MEQYSSVELLCHRIHSLEQTLGETSQYACRLTKQGRRITRRRVGVKGVGVGVDAEWVCGWLPVYGIMRAWLRSLAHTPTA